jgi:hypothetical protein
MSMCLISKWLLEDHVMFLATGDACLKLDVVLCVDVDRYYFIGQIRWFAGYLDVLLAMLVTVSVSISPF